MPNLIPAKKIPTFNSHKNQNGYLIELQKSDPNNSTSLTSAYLTVTFPHALKGYHLHKIREANYICIKGKIYIITITNSIKTSTLLNSISPSYFHIPTHTPTALYNPFPKEAWIINFPSPPYDPSLKDEQIDFPPEPNEFPDVEFSFPTYKQSK